jgi:hypothetical protein
MALERRITQLEDELYTEDDGPSLAQRLHEALEEARERRRQGRPAPEPPPDLKGPLGKRLRQAWERAEACRRQLRS